VRPRIAHDPLDVQEEIRGRLAAARQRLTDLGDVEAHVAYGRPAEELARYGESVDLLVVGPHDRDGDGVLHHTAVAQRLAHSSPCPLLVAGKPATVASAGA
jgi:nucleotide-binding universal stress UspA family protein